MSKSFGEKLKILYIRDYLMKYSDEQHPVTVNDLIEELDRHNIQSERRSIYRDLKVLGCTGDLDDPDTIEDNYGLDIVKRHGEYFLRSREFTLQEVKLLIDMIQSSNFLTKKKTSELISKIEKLTSIHEAKTLNRTVFVRNRVKAMNESVFINVDKISEAINNDRILHFQYFSYNINKKKELKHNGEIYCVSPFALIWVDQNYYVLGFSHSHETIRTYRVDRMTHVTTANGPRRGKPEFEKIDIATFTTKVFHMFLGEIKRVSVRFDKSLADTVIDRFGEDIMIIPDGEDRFTVNMEVSISPQFYGWVAGFGDLAEIVAPESVRKGMEEHLTKAVSYYRKNS